MANAGSRRGPVGLTSASGPPGRPGKRRALRRGVAGAIRVVAAGQLS